ncbi:hypothetical protein NPX99_05335 [Bartonella sp. 220]|uniref:hypothetical protein n=1 Tax=Bartonella sp. 220B TaxID=2967260 RepID=UPI0022A97D3F|nr:hypothetical protein [Bartonella sp. 220B]MCZ2158697.1 hypothetical protein [Bartonella sp. 220B]
MKSGFFKPRQFSNHAKKLSLPEHLPHTNETNAHKVVTRLAPTANHPAANHPAANHRRQQKTASLAKQDNVLWNSRE